MESPGTLVCFGAGELWTVIQCLLRRLMVTEPSLPLVTWEVGVNTTLTVTYKIF